MNVERHGTGLTRWLPAHTIAALLAALAWAYHLTGG